MGLKKSNWLVSAKACGGDVSGEINPPRPGWHSFFSISDTINRPPYGPTAGNHGPDTQTVMHGDCRRPHQVLCGFMLAFRFHQGPFITNPDADESVS